jgi:hypothetical protein
VVWYLLFSAMIGVNNMWFREGNVIGSKGRGWWSRIGIGRDVRIRRRLRRDDDRRVFEWKSALIKTDMSDNVQTVGVRVKTTIAMM